VKKQIIYFIIACAILILSSLFVRGHGTEVKTLSSQPIVNFPLEIEEFHGKTVFPSDKNFHDPSADNWILRIYSKKGHNKPIRVFLGYWESQNEGKRVNSPRYTIGGWEYYWIKAKSVTLGSKIVKLKEFLNERGNEKELVYYCYIVNGKIISSEYRFRFFSMLSSLLTGRNNAALLRISMPVTDEWTVEKAEVYEEDFLRAILPLIQKYI
jgi:EpsI family protein